ncbi:MAG: FapA family protein [Lachnospiraceae bacterium]|nr:FapA family protein [Lachnospiraceae bacterium]
MIKDFNNLDNFDYFQQKEIQKGLEKKIDISLYAKPEIPFQIMCQLRKGLEYGYDLTPYITYGAGVLHELVKSIQSGVSLIPYVHAGYDSDQLNAIRQTLEKQIAIDPYLDISYRGACINEIAIGLEHHIDITPYAKTCYTWRKMREIRLGIEQRLDISKYSNPLYSYWQMREIRQGLMDGLDISYYQSLMYTAKEMKKRRLQLMDQHHSPIAIETEPENGRDGYYDFQFETKNQQTLQLSDDGSIDFDRIKWFEPVSKDQILAVYHAPSPGKNGKTVTGTTIPAIPGKEQPVLTGNGFELLPDQKTYVACKNGHVRLQKSELTVSDLIRLDNLSPAEEPLSFNGDVYVKGTITGPLVINVNGDLVVEGFVNGAEIHCTGNLVLKSGINASSVENTLTAGKQVICKFFEYVTLSAGKNISFGTSLNSNLSCYGSIISYGEKGGIIGGSCYAEKGFCLSNIGNSAGNSTTLLLGTNDHIRLQSMRLEKEILNIKTNISQLKDAYQDAYKNIVIKKHQRNDLLIHLKDAIDQKNEELETAHQKNEQVNKRRTRACSSRIIVENQIHQNVDVQYMSRKINAIPSENVAILINDNHLVMEKYDFSASPQIPKEIITT